MRILYVSSVPSPAEFYRMKKHIRPGVNITDYGMNEAGFKFHSLIQRGLVHDPYVQIRSLAGRSTSFSKYRGVIWRGSRKRTEKTDYVHLGYINVPVLKQSILCASFFFHTLGWLIKYKNEKDKYIIADAAYVTVVPFVTFAAKLMRCKILAVFCDIYAYMANVSDARAKAAPLKRLIGKLMKSIYKIFDCFVFLTEDMNILINPLSKPYIVIEGIADMNMTQAENREKAGHKIVMYAGALREQYGLKNLIEGFMAFRDTEARLCIYGSGDFSDNIKEASRSDGRIKFFGQADLSEITMKEIEASLLVNPRPASHEFTRYSFPSKIIEYMASGTPVLTTRLPGIPPEYYEHVYTIDGGGARSVTLALEKVFSVPEEKRREKGLGAKKFVLEKKNNIVQAERIIMLLKGLH